MNTKKILLFISLAVISLMNTSCLLVNLNSVTGSGSIESKNINLSSFNSVQIQSSADVYINRGEDLNVTLSDYGNLLSYWNLEVEGNNLLIKTDQLASLINSRAKVIITLPTDLYNIKINGSGNVYLNSSFSTLDKVSIEGSGKVFSSQSANYNNLSIYIGGSGDVNLSGSAQQYIAKIEGSGSVKSAHLRAKNADCRISGSGSIYVNAQETLKARIYGSGDIIYTGRPIVDFQHSGSGNLIHE